MSRDLLVIGAGELGARVGLAWRSRHPDSAVWAETSGIARHAMLAELGLIPRQRTDPDSQTVGHILFCVPPSSNVDYRAEAERAIRLWNGRGAFVFTSSTAVYPDRDLVCDEFTPTELNDRNAALIAAEEAVLGRGGCVVRLAGLYDENRGPHRVWARQERSDLDGNKRINLIHYDDAAWLCVAALALGARGETYLGCDGAPIARQALARSMRVYRGGNETRFTGAPGDPGRICYNEWTRTRLSWKPVYDGFLDWIAAAEPPT